MRAHLPCPRREATRARNRNPLCLRADIPDNVEASSTSIESASSTRAMAGTSIKNLRQTDGIKSRGGTDLARAGES